MTVSVHIYTQCVSNPSPLLCLWMHVQGYTKVSGFDSVTDLLLSVCTPLDDYW